MEQYASKHGVDAWCMFMATHQCGHRAKVFNIGQVIIEIYIRYYVQKIYHNVIILQYICGNCHNDGP